MSEVQRTILISSEMNRRIDQIALEAGTTPGAVVGKALDLYLVARDKARQGLRLGFAKQSD